MANKKLKVITLAADLLVQEALKSIVLACNYKHMAVNDYRDLVEKIKIINVDIILIDEDISFEGQKENYYNVFSKYNESIPVIVAVKEEQKKLFNKDIFSYVKKPINISIFKKLMDPYSGLKEKQKVAKIKIGEHVYDNQSKVLKLTDGRHIRFTGIESSLILIFIKNINVSLSQSFLMENIWGYTSEIDTNTLKTHIWRLRKKLNDKSLNFDLFTLNDGYIFKKK